MRYFIQFLLLLGLINTIYAESIEVKVFANTQQERRYRALINEIRCPVCQGQSIGGSNAGLAKDLRTQVRNMIIKDKNNDEIRQFMVDRYGDFVVFKPPVNNRTYLLWFAPFIFLILGLLLFFRSLKSRQAQTIQVDIAKAKTLLK